MRYAVERWNPSYGSPGDRADAGAQSTAELDLDIEVAADAWEPVRVGDGTDPPPVVLIVDGVRRIDAYLWGEAEDGSSQPVVAASYAAGVVRCDLRRKVAEVVHHRVERGLFTTLPGATGLGVPPAVYEPKPARGGSHEELATSVQGAMLALELVVSEEARTSSMDDDDLLVTDGPMRGRHRLARTIGYTKSLDTRYLPTAQTRVVTSCRPGERSPVFRTGPQWPHHSWYLRLPGDTSHPWAGIVRVQGSPDLTREQAVALADRSAVTLPRFASQAYKDPRAPQNLMPVAGLERRLRALLGDARLLHRSLTRASVR